MSLWVALAALFLFMAVHVAARTEWARELDQKRAKERQWR